MAPYMESVGFSRGDNEKSAFLHEDRDLLDLTFVDDNYLDGAEDDILWGHGAITDRFECKELEWITSEPTDYLGMLMSITTDRTILSMETYIEVALDVLGWKDLRPARTPIRKPIDPTTPRLSDAMAHKFHTAQGMLGWLDNTCRPDVSYARSRISQHQAAPTESALDAVQYAFRYLKGTKHLCLSGLLQSSPDQDIISTVMGGSAEEDAQFNWEFYCDSDYAGNSEPQNKRRSQNGLLVTLNKVPVYWWSKISSVCFACEDIGEAHADQSSAAVEIFVAGNATKDILHLSYVADEIGIPFPKPFKLQMDNEAAKCFAEDTVSKSKLKHIDARQEWVKILRDREICTPVHVDSADNLADIFTKILSVDTFERLRDQLLWDPNK